MDLISIIGIIVAIGSLVLGYSIDGGSIFALWLLSAAIIVVGGALGSLLISYGFRQIKKLPGLLLSIFIQPPSKISKTIDFLVKLSESARKDGILSLEKIIEAEETKSSVDPFLKSGVMMVVDGADLEQIKSFLETDISVYEQKAASEIGMFDSLAQYAPAYGMIGTIMGLIQVLANMESPETMAAAISVAFITTLYGVIIANALCIPAANKLRVRLEYYQTEKEMIIEGISGIRNGDNPKILRERLSPYLVYESSPKTGKQKGNGENGKKKAK
ncbi:MAG: MotA/TolQ/ExbB proton channel family protein [Clostridiaceae bacterium]|nr:MotA/TolQ/ExbB proton channel family protein [Clostridiaceae bacterium]